MCVWNICFFILIILAHTSTRVGSFHFDMKMTLPDDS